MTSQRTRERLIQRLMDQGITRFEVLEAIRSVPRHLFVDEALAHRSYEDTALPIGYGQTLSQPYVVAKMSELALAHGRPKKVLELGSGSGYQTAILASLVDEICAIERIKPLLDRARRQLRELRVRNVRLRHGDGLEGWPSEAPFDLILGAAAPEHIPSDLLEQLAPGGRLIMPVGGRRQQLMMVTASPEGYVEEVIEEVKASGLRGRGARRREDTRWRAVLTAAGALGTIGACAAIARPYLVHEVSGERTAARASEKTPASSGSEREPEGFRPRRHHRNARAARFAAEGLDLSAAPLDPLHRGRFNQVLAAVALERGELVARESTAPLRVAVDRRDAAQEGVDARGRA